MKFFFVLFLVALNAAPFYARAEDEPVLQDEFGGRSPLPFERRRPKPRTPVETHEDRENKDEAPPPPPPTPRHAARRERDDSGIFGRELPWWNARACNNALGFEAPSPSSASLLGSGAVIYGGWLSEGVGMDFYFGLSRTAGTAAQTATVAENAAAKTRSTTTVYSGQNNPLNITIGTYLKFRAYSNNWFSLHLGPQVAFSPTAKATTVTGSSLETIANTDSSGNKTVTETAYGTIETNRGTLISLGPKLGAEFYLKWIPHLAVGMSTGVMAVLGGTTVQTTTTANKTITYTDGVASDPGTVPTTTQTVTTERGLEASTFGLGGTTFSFVGTFTLRYIF